MKISDPVYGDRNVEDNVIEELVGSSPVQRLKGINQAGPQQFTMEKSVTRFDHSLGVMVLLREFGASLEEQIAGLLHDVPHTAFSHAVDYVFRTEEHDYHEDFLEDIVLESEIPGILERHGFDVNDFFDHEKFGLLERELPDLCADRIDYFLRALRINGGEDVEELLKSLQVEDGRFVLDDRERAEEFALRYIEANERWWANPHEVAIYEIFARAVSRALDTGVLDRDDLFLTDMDMWESLKKSGDEEIGVLLDSVERGPRIRIDPEDHDFVSYPKVRYVDPEVLVNGGTRRVSEFSEEVRERIEDFRERALDGYPIKVEGSSLKI